MNKLEYNATLTATEFHFSRSPVKLLFGCVGSGKSVACMLEIFLNASAQEPGADGIRRSKWAIIRNTYPELKATTIKTWLEWFPESKFGKIKYDSPIVHHIKYNDIDLEVLFLPLETHNDVKKLKSFELTGAYINEAQFISEEIFVKCRERTNRFPPKRRGIAASYPCVIMDANPPSTHHWIFDVFERTRPEDFSIFKYKPAVLKINEQDINGRNYSISKNCSIYINNEDADFVSVQSDPNYWLKLISGNEDDLIKVDYMGQYGVVKSGRPVHPTYNDSLHYSNLKIPYSKEVQIGLGWDFGLTPACAIVQLTPRGKLLILDELWSTHMGLRDFAGNIVIPHLDRHYEGWRNNYVSVHDPAGSTGSQTDGRNCEDILKELGIKSSSAAGNNNPEPRRDGLDFFLGRMTDGTPAFSVSSSAQMIREGLMGQFQYGRIQVGGDAKYHEKPLKNIYSHICEATEYIAMFYSSEHKKPVASLIKPNIIRSGSFMAF